MIGGHIGVNVNNGKQVNEVSVSDVKVRYVRALLTEKKNRIFNITTISSGY